MPRHKVFFSYHRADDEFRRKFVREFGRAFDDFSVRSGEIPEGLATDTVQRKIRDEYIRDATVTVVLIGKQTWQRKHVDWEIDASLRHTQANSRTGLLGIVLPSYLALRAELSPSGKRYERVRGTTPVRSAYTPNNIPPRLWDNVEPNGFALIRPWPAGAIDFTSSELEDWIHMAFQRRHQNPPPVLARPRFGRNRSEVDPAWED